MGNSFAQHISQMLLLGKKIIKDNPLLTEEIGTVNAKGDKTIGMDVKIEQSLIDYIKDKNLPFDIFSEEIGMIKYHKNPTHIIAFDPLDGSANYKTGKNLLPYGLLIAVYEGLNPKLQDVVCAGAIEYSRDLAWIFTDKRTLDLKGNKISLNSDWQVNPSTPIYLDLYYRDGYKAYTPLAQQIFIRNTGSTIGNLSYVLSNAGAGLGGVCMRPEEIGAIVALIKGAGGIAVNHLGNDLGEEKFSPEKTYQILAGSKNVIEFVLNKIK